MWTTAIHLLRNTWCVKSFRSLSLSGFNAIFILNASLSQFDLGMSDMSAVCFCIMVRCVLFLPAKGVSRAAQVGLDVSASAKK